jgi:phage terminase small subunit
MTRAERAIAEAERLAGMLAAAPAIDGVPLSPPAFFADPRLKPVLTVWLDEVVLLSRRGMIEDVDRYQFALYCVYVVEFFAATEDILVNGYSMPVKTVSGDRMLRENPSVSRRDVAAKMILELSRRFGKTALDRYALLRTQKIADAAPGLFDASPALAEEPVDPHARAWDALLNQGGDPPRPN